MKIELVNVGTKANDGTGDTLPDAWKKANRNFERLSKVFNLKLDKVKETGSIEDIRPNMIIINENFSKLENRLND